ncbi:MAG: hypothetical protein IJ438_10450 [Clostridia bacterium]|nr:hypothetical protein [Clostridia bacterium]
MLSWELLGAVVGAGLASGRELASFFARYGVWSWAAIAAAMITMVFAAQVRIPDAWRGRWMDRLWQLLLTLMLTITGGAMLSGAGEVVSLMLPVHGAYWVGMAATLLSAWYLAYRTGAGLAWVSRLLACAMAMIIAAGWALPPLQAVPLDAARSWEAILRGVSYGGFNAVLLIPILRASGACGRTQRRCIGVACTMLTVLILLGNAVLLRHPALLTEELPFIRMMAYHGQTGYVLSGVCLYLAVLSTMTACLRGIQGMRWAIAGMALTAAMGFSGAVDVLYPLLGGACLAMLIAAKLSIFFGNTFIRRDDML